MAAFKGVNGDVGGVATSPSLHHDDVVLVTRIVVDCLVGMTGITLVVVVVTVIAAKCSSRRMLRAWALSALVNYMSSGKEKSES